MWRGVVTQMRLRTLLPVEGWPSGELALMKGQPCEACMAAQVGDIMYLIFTEEEKNVLVGLKTTNLRRTSMPLNVPT